MNDVVKAADKNIKKIVQKMVVMYKDWHEMFLFVMYAYRTAIRKSTRVAPYSLIYMIEAIMSLEVEISSLKVLMESELEEAN